MIESRDLVAYCDRLLDAGRFSDYAPNGLQVEGDRPIRSLVTGVTASAALIDAAIQEGADAILVHHGWFWKNENPCLTGIKGRRARAILEAGIALLAYHLPLDAHAELGNNARLAVELDIRNAEPTGIGNGLVWVGRLSAPMTAESFANEVTQRLGREPVMVGRRLGQLERIAWCSGGGQGYLEQAVALGADVFLSGELSEQTAHVARESDVCYLAAGHHATERYGVQALGTHLAEHFGLRHHYIEIDNPA
ncbi:Nif3-like dinuclear metal center hexameric protein [Thiorhodococcus fuscus]|uniref:Nif3-like dinuclear metal center hexameric protein n=1 Tax=Thiorhodococcus fuscus TaxID=527200 RepID=A0ABW4Y845_9GAMM